MNSLWIDSIENKNKFKKLEKDISTDVCIIGAGIFGLTCGYYLVKQGYNVTILEKEHEIASKTTGHTTAKITSQHNLIYKYLIDSLGKVQAKKYLYANQEAIENIARIVKDENIDCDFERTDSYVYTRDKDELEKIKLENEAVNSLEFDSEFVTETPLPFEVLGAIKFSNQAQFNPLKYAYGLADKITKDSGKIYTNTLVQNIEKEGDYFITYTENNKVKSKYVILASHYPFIDRLGYYFLKMYQSISYVIAVDTHGKTFNGMYINSEIPTFSYRFVNYKDKKLLLVGGADHKTGSKIDLSEDEQYAINQYIGPESYRINEALRNNLELTKQQEKIIDNLDKVLDKMPNYDGIVQRSIILDKEQLKKFLELHKEGNIIKYKAYTSSTVGNRYNDFSNVELLIKSLNGKDIRKYNKEEQEILFKRNTKFKIIRKEKVNDIYYIQMEEINE